MIAQLAGRDANLPPRLIDRAVAKWMHGSEDDWDPGYIDGPVQQLTLMAVHYESARTVLRAIAQDEWTYSEDAAYAAQGLAKAGLEWEARAFLAAISQRANAYCGSRVLAVELLVEIGAEAEARACADALAWEWANDPPDMDFSWMYLAKTFHRLGRKRAAADILNRLDRELNEELDLFFLAETYLALDRPRKAKAAALRAFNTKEWSRNSWRGDNREAMDMAVLLDRVGAIEEAAFIRKNLKTLENQENEELRAAATDPQRSAEDRLKCARELLERHDIFGLEALELLLSDAGAPQYERFSTVPELLASSLRAATISTLKRVAVDEPWYRIQCGKALVLGGEPEKGCKILSQVAFEPAEPARNRADAIEQLVRSGRIDLAISAFRRLRHSGDLKPHCLEQIANAFAHTSAWAEVLDHCDNLLSSDDPTLRIDALNILVRAKRIGTDSKYAENLLRNILSRRELPLDVRIKAARSLVGFEVETTLDLVFDIATSPEETMEAGIEAMQFLYYRDEFLAIDGGHDVVWDKKLSLDQFIEAAHVFLSMVDRRRNSTYESVVEGICGAMIEALQEIAADPAQPIERRFAAARVKNPSDGSYRLDEPLWPGVDAICQDEATPIRLRWPAIRYALQKDPARIELWRTLLDGGEFSHLETAYLYLAADCSDEAAESFHRALVEESDLHIRVQIWKELVLLVEWPFAGREAARALSEAVKSGAVECLKSELLEDLLRLSKAALSIDELVELAKEVVNHRGLSAYNFEPAARTLIEYGATAVVRTILEARKISAQNHFQTDDIAFYELIHLHRLQAQLIKRDAAAKAMNDICSNSKLGVSQRAFACRILSRIGRTGDARVRLRRLLTKATSWAEQLSIGRTAVDIHDWSLARQTFLALAKSPSMTPTERINCASGLAKVGFKKSAINILSSIDLIANDIVWQGGIEVLIACGQAERAIAICREYIERAEICALDKMEALGKLGDGASKRIARNLLVRLASESDCDVSACARGAELLHSMGFKAEAHSILFRLSDQPIPDIHDALWVADALIVCALPLTAQKVLDSINSKSLDGNEERHFREIKFHARYSFLQGVTCG